MQLINGAIKHGSPQPPMASTELAEYEDVDLDTFDLSAFVIPSATKDKGKLAVHGPSQINRQTTPLNTDDARFCRNSGFWPKRVASLTW